MLPKEINQNIKYFIAPDWVSNPQPSTIKINEESESGKKGNVRSRLTLESVVSII